MPLLLCRCSSPCCCVRHRCIRVVLSGGGVDQLHMICKGLCFLMSPLGCVCERRCVAVVEVESARMHPLHASCMTSGCLHGWRLAQQQSFPAQSCRCRNCVRLSTVFILCQQAPLAERACLTWGGVSEHLRLAAAGVGLFCLVGGLCVCHCWLQRLTANLAVDPTADGAICRPCTGGKKCACRCGV